VVATRVGTGAAQAPSVKCLGVGAARRARRSGPLGSRRPGAGGPGADEAALCSTTVPRSISTIPDSGDWRSCRYSAATENRRACTMRDQTDHRTIAAALTSAEAWSRRGTSSVSRGNEGPAARWNWQWERDAGDVLTVCSHPDGGVMFHELPR
jgi:hypothetical protein